MNNTMVVEHVILSATAQQKLSVHWFADRRNVDALMDMCVIQPMFVLLRVTVKTRLDQQMWIQMPVPKMWPSQQRLKLLFRQHCHRPVRLQARLRVHRLRPVQLMYQLQNRLQLCLLCWVARQLGQHSLFIRLLLLFALRLCQLTIQKCRCAV